MLTEQQRAAIRARCEAATAPPWEIETAYDREEWEDSDGIWCTKDWPYLALRLECGHPERLGSHEGGRIHRENDAAFIAASRTDLPAVLADYEALLGVHERLVAAVDYAETVLTVLVHPKDDCGQCALRQARAALSEARALHATEEGD